MKTNRPNILLITSDQQHHSALGSVNDRIQTPALDRLAREGTRFGRAYCPSPVCTPSRASIITGMYPSLHGAWTIGVKLDESIPTVGGYLSAAGYQTSLIGKAHFQPLASTEEETSIEAQPTLRDLDFWRSFHGPWYGFDHVETARMHADEYHVGGHYAIWMEEHGLTDWADYFQPLPGETNDHADEYSWRLPEELHYTTWTGERTVAAIERAVDADEPFFTWASFHDPHPPYLVPEPWASMYDPADMEPGTLLPGELDVMPRHFGLTQETSPDFSSWMESGFANHGFRSHLVSDEELRKNMAVYYGMVSFMDQQIGRILDALDRLGVADNTLVVFSTDHGHFLGQHGLHHKGAFHYEDLIRIPFLAKLPGTVASDRTSTAIQNLVDLAPTFLSLAGCPIPGMMQGVDQLPAWSEGGLPARSWSLTENRHQPNVLNVRTLVTENAKVTVYRGSEDGELFDLVTDPDERRNLWNEPSAADLKSHMLLRFEQAEMEREPTRYPRIAHA